MLIRKFISTDRKAVADIHFETGFLGKSMSIFLTKRRLFDMDVQFYLDKMADNIFVVEEDNKVVGYIFGCLDDKDDNLVLRIIPSMINSMLNLPFMPKKDRKYWLSRFRWIFDNLISKSDSLKMKHPSDAGHIHINLLPDARGKGYGTRLMKEFCRYAKKKGVKVIHADGFMTDFNPNENFWKKNDFTVFSKVRTDFWKKYLPDKDIYLVCRKKTL